MTDGEKWTQENFNLSDIKPIYCWKTATVQVKRLTEKQK